MANPSNNGVLIGRVAKGGVHQFQNADGSKNVKFTLAVEENFKRRGKNDVETDFIPVQTFVPAKAQADVWGKIGEGDLIAINTRLSCKAYMGKDGNMVYPPATVEVDGYPKFLEPKSVTDKRKADKAANAAVAAPEAAEALSTEDQVAALEAQLAALKVE